MTIIGVFSPFARSMSWHVQQLHDNNIR